MPDVLDLTDGLLRLTDGTRTFDVSPCAGDANLADGADTVTYLHRGKIISDGSGTRLADETNAEATFTAMVKSDELIDGVNLVTLCDWMRGETSAAMTAASWASTTTRRDEHRTLHVDWYPAPTLVAGVPTPSTGDRYYRIADALLVDVPKAEGRATTWSMTFRSATAARPDLQAVP